MHEPRPVPSFESHPSRTRILATRRLVPQVAARAALALVVLATAACGGDAPAPRPPAPLVPMGAAPSGGAASVPTPAAPPAAPSGAGAATSGSDPSAWHVSTSADDPNSLEVGGLRAPKPASWAWTKPTVQFRTLQYAVPGDGDSTKAAELVVSLFVGDGGPLEANVERWRNQFRVGGKPPEAKRSSKDVGPLKVEFVELEGEFLAMGAPSPKEGFLQLAAIVQADGRNVFFRLVGPKETVERNRADFLKLVDGLMPAD